MGHYDDWNWDGTPTDWDEWDAWQESQQEEQDEEWEDEYFRTYREQYPEEFDDPDDPSQQGSGRILSTPDPILDYIRSLFPRKRYTDEPIAPRPSPEPLPPPLQAARSLEGGMALQYQNRASLFLKQAKLLEDYEDDSPLRLNAHVYYPTYAELSDRQLRSYFAFRTRLRWGEDPGTCISFAYIYIYELLNGIGVANPREGLEKLDALPELFRHIDSTIAMHLKRWREDYIVYYDLPPELNRPNRDDSFAQLDEAETMDTRQIVDILKSADSIASWLNRSKCYAAHRGEFDRVLADTIRGICRRCSGRTRSFCDRYFGILHEEPIRMFGSAVFADPLKRRTFDYTFAPWDHYRLRDGVWTRRKRYITETGIRKLVGLVKSVDNVLRAQFDPKHLIQAPAQQKWIDTLIRDSLQSILDEQEAARREQEKLKIDYSALARIRADADITREKLRVEEEEETEEDTPQEIPEPVPGATPVADTAPGDCPLNAQEYRLMQCLLYGGDTGWIQREGLMESILLDSINEKLYDIFQDSVAEDAGIVEDYIDELKEMILP